MVKLFSLKKKAPVYTQFIVVICSFIAALIVGGVLLAIDGQNPFEIYEQFFILPLQSGNNIVKVLIRVTPLIFSGLAVAIAFKCNIFNIGVEGQLYVSGLTAAFLGYYITGLPSWLHVLVCVVGAMIAGGFTAFIPAILKIKLNVHEVVTTIMLNYIIANLISLYVVNYFRYDGPIARTPDVQNSAKLATIVPDSTLNIGLIIAVLLCVAMSFVLKHTPFGYRVDAAGKNLTAARYSGINSKKLILTTMIMSGAIAALVGVERVLGTYGYMEVNFSPGYGWDGITIAIIAANHPFGVLLMACLLGLLSYGGTLAGVLSGIASEWVNVISALVFIFVVLGNAIVNIMQEKNFKLWQKGDK